MISDNDLVFVGKDGQEIARLSTIGNYTKIGPIVHFGLNDTVDKTIEHKITRLKEPENMGTMKILAYTQKDGFKEIDFSPDWPDGLDFSEWLILAGFKDKSDCNIGTPDHYNIDEYAGDKGILVAFSCEEFCQNILVENSADCFALRLKLLPILHKNHIKEAEIFLEEILMRIKQASHR